MLHIVFSWKLRERGTKWIPRKSAGQIFSHCFSYEVIWSKFARIPWEICSRYSAIYVVDDVASTRVIFWAWIWPTGHGGLGKWLLNFKIGKSQRVSFDSGNNYDAINVEWLGLFIMKKHLLKSWHWDCLPCLNWMGDRSFSLFLWDAHTLCYSNKLHDFSVAIPRCHKECLCQQFLYLLS